MEPLRVGDFVMAKSGQLGTIVKLTEKMCYVQIDAQTKEAKWYKRSDVKFFALPKKEEESYSMSEGDKVILPDGSEGKVVGIGRDYANVEFEKTGILKTVSLKDLAPAISEPKNQKPKYLIRFGYKGQKVEVTVEADCFAEALDLAKEELDDLDVIHVNKSE